MKGLILFADTFEDCEAIGCFDVLLRAGHQVDRISMMEQNEVVSKCGIKMSTTKMFGEVNLDDYDYLVIPGGPASFRILNTDVRVEKTIDYFITNNKLVASICAAPHLLGRKGYFKGRNFTCHPGFEDKCLGGNYLRNQGVVIDDRFVTAKSMYYSQEFALGIVEFLEGKEKANTIRKNCQGANY